MHFIILIHSQMLQHAFRFQFLNGIAKPDDNRNEKLWTFVLNLHIFIYCTIVNLVYA